MTSTTLSMETAASLSELRASFEANIRSSLDLLSFDDVLLMVVLQMMSKTNSRLKKANIENHRLTLDRAIEEIRNIQRNESLRPYYEGVSNQCVVLLVSHFASGLGSYFRRCIGTAIRRGAADEASREKLTVTVGEIRDLAGGFDERVGELLIERKGISFQDMQSATRAFESYFGVRPYPRGRDLNDLIVAQACRHAIVHAGAIVDTRLTNQIRDATDRTIQSELLPGSRIQFSRDEVKSVARSMQGFVRHLEAELRRVLSA